MPSLSFFVSALALLSSSSLASPTPAGDAAAASKKGGSAWASKSLSSLQGVTPTATPTAIAQASKTLSSIFNTKPTPDNLFDTIGNLVEAGLTTDNIQDGINFIEGLLDSDNSETNINLINPSPAAYPKAKAKDAPFSLSEAALRAAIHIPSTFKYGKGAQPIILVPGTGDDGYTTFAGNYITLFQGQNADLGDPVWLNIPGFLLGDAQVSAEYVAYAINYIYGISNHRKVAVFGWSQGNIDAQWAFKYWPSTRNRVTDHVAFSPDYHGTVLANLIATPGEPLPPSVLQQDYNSDFITTLRANNGDSAYVPTTTIYSGFFDEIVEPQQGTGASAYLLDSRNVGVSNNEVQLVCKGQAAGSFYTHEGTLYNPLGHALAMDALKHDGPGKVSRVNLQQVCSDYLTPGLSLVDFLETENSILVAGLSILLYPASVINEPSIMAYAK